MNEPYYTDPESVYDERYGDGTGMLFKLLDATREIAHAGEINGPAGRQLGQYVKAALAGRSISDLTIGELTRICEKSSEDYNEKWRLENRSARQ